MRFAVKKENPGSNKMLAGIFYKKQKGN